MLYIFGNRWLVKSQVKLRSQGHDTQPFNSHQDSGHVLTHVSPANLQSSKNCVWSPLQNVRSIAVAGGGMCEINGKEICIVCYMW